MAVTEDVDVVDTSDIFGQVLLFLLFPSFFLFCKRGKKEKKYSDKLSK